jgi:hypothetical protein
MFEAKCDILGREVMIWTSDVKDIHNTEHGIAVHYRCACGREAVMLTGIDVPLVTTSHVGQAA